MPDPIENNESYSTAEKYCACIEFHLPEHKRHGFSTSQLIEYTLEPNPDAEDDNGGRAPAPPQKLTLGFSTADVVILGWWLGQLADKLRENNLAVVRVQPERFANLKRFVPFVASVAITPVEKLMPN